MLPQIHNHKVFAPVKPAVPATIGAALQGPDRENWKKGLFAQCDKNNSFAVFTSPFPRSQVPPGERVLRSVISPAIKPVGDNIYRCAPRHCADGGPQQKGHDFDHSAAPTLAASTVRAIVAIAARFNLTLATADVTDAHQNTIKPTSQRFYATLPPYYMDWHRLRHPNVKIEPSQDGKCVLQGCTSFQGAKPAGREWNSILNLSLQDQGLTRNPVDQALHVRRNKDGTLIVGCSTDDFLCAFTSRNLFVGFIAHMSRCFPVTYKEGPKLSYLNLRIVQSEHGISIDQTEHMRETILDHWFPDASTKVKGSTTPFSTDSACETELAETLPAPPQQLRELEVQCKGTFPMHVGKFLHIMQCTRPDIMYAVNRLGSYSSGPSAPAFKGLKHLAR